MIIRIKKELIKQFSFIFLGLLLIIMVILGISISTESVFAGNVTNQTVIARVNVTNTEPTLYKVVMEYPLDLQGNIDLGAGNATTVACNGSFSDVNGYDDIVSVNATLFFNATSSSDANDDNNTHYTNSSCLVGGNTCTENGEDSNNGSCICQFAVQYFANPGNWICNMTINDSWGLTSTENSSLTYLNEILGIEVETTTLDFGNVSASQTSDLVRQNVTNLGNVPINVTVRGYGGNNETIGQNLSMICDPTRSTANITFDYMRFDTINITTYANMTNITNQTKQIFNLTIPQRTHTTMGYGNTSNSTFWRLQIPIGAGGLCNGTIIFGALQDFN